ncbi:unnamed protein product [Lactuca virosa]|uniref:TMEM205-like domain-containing protein n=1 Tax=Lactuca virosa TaxID=75947 RepID=A0AAU9ME99_9ASTR|nr:unnamed protein product [Lactuca virosa]
MSLLVAYPYICRPHESSHVSDHILKSKEIRIFLVIAVSKRISLSSKHQQTYGTRFDQIRLTARQTLMAKTRIIQCNHSPHTRPDTAIVISHVCCSSISLKPMVCIYRPYRPSVNSITIRLNNRELSIKTMHLVFLCLVLTSLVTGATWSPSPPPHHHRFVVEFDEEPDGNTKVSISQHDDDAKIDAGGFAAGPRELFGKCRYKLANVIEKTKNVVSGKRIDVSSELHNFEEQVKEVTDEVVKVGDPKVKLSEKLSEKFKAVGEKAKDVAGIVKNAVGKPLGLFTSGEGTKGTLKDSVLKVEQWDLVDSPKRIGEDIESNATRKVEEGVEEMRETVKTVQETSWNDLLTRSTSMATVLIDKIQSVISWCHLLGFSTAYGMGVWVTFFSSSVLGKCLPKRQYGMIINKLHMVYFRAMSYCIGAAFIGYLVSLGRNLFFLSNKMAVFQGFNLLSALLMNLINMMFLEPRATKIKKIKEDSGTKSTVSSEKLQLSTYSSTLNFSTMVVLTWHLAYIGQLVQAGNP